MNGGEEDCLYDVGGKARRKETTKETDLGGRIIFEWILER
jgi:hypothetical protein